MHGVDFDDCIMGLDIDTQHIGWAVVRGGFHETGHGRFRTEPFGKFLLTFHKWLKDLVQEQQPAVICLELPFVGQTAAVQKLYKMHGVAEMALAGFVGAIDTVHSALWKKQICGRGNITTAEKKAGMIVNIMRNKGYNVSQIDEADALCIALYERKKLTTGLDK